MPYLFREDTPPTESDLQVINALSLLEDPGFRTLLREASHVNVNPYQKLKEIHAFITQDVDFHVLYTGAGQRVWKMYQRGPKMNFPEIVGVCFFPGSEFPVSGIPNSRELGMSRGYISFDFKIIHGTGTPGKTIPMPGYYRIYVGKEYARLEAINYQLPVSGIVTEPVNAQIIEADWHEPSKQFNEKYWDFTSADSMNIEAGEGAFPHRVTTRHGVDKSAEAQDMVVRGLFKKRERGFELFSQSEQHFLRSAGELAHYRGNLIVGDEGVPTKTEGYVLLDDVRAMVKEKLDHPKELCLTSPEDIERRLQRLTPLGSWSDTDATLYLKHLRFVDKTMTEQLMQALHEPTE